MIVRNCILSQAAAEASKSSEFNLSRIIIVEKLTRLTSKFMGL